MNKPELKSKLADIMNQYFTKCESELATSTLSEYYRAVKSLDCYLVKSNYNGDDISADLIDSWALSLQPKKRSTIRQYQKIVTLFLKFASAYVVKSQLPKLVEDAKDYAPHIFTDEERSKIFSFLDSYVPRSNSKNQYIRIVIPMVIRIMDCCGTRETETLSLQMKDVNLQEGTLTLRNTKRSKERIVPISDSLNTTLRSYCLAMGITSTPDAFLFPGKSKDERLKSGTFSKLISKILSNVIGESRSKKHDRSICAHCFRHSFACRSLEHMKDLGFDEDDRYPYLSTYLGHVNLYPTERYLQYPTERLDKDIEKFDDTGKDLLSSIPLFGENIFEWEK